MARGDTEYCRVELDFLLDNPEWLTLAPSHAKIYLWLWARAVKDRVETLEKRWSTKAVAKLSHSRHRDVTELIRVGTEMGWLKVEDDGRITVCGVMSKHAKLRGWRDKNGDPYGDLSSVREREREREKEKPPLPPEGEGRAFRIWLEVHSERGIPTGAQEMDASRLQDILDEGRVTEDQLRAAVNALLDDKEFRHKTLQVFTKHLDRFLCVKPEKKKDSSKLVLALGDCPKCGFNCSGMVKEGEDSGLIKCDCGQEVRIAV